MDPNRYPPSRPRIPSLMSNEFIIPASAEERDRMGIEHQLGSNGPRYHADSTTTTTSNDTYDRIGREDYHHPTFHHNHHHHQDPDESLIPGVGRGLRAEHAGAPASHRARLELSTRAAAALDSSNLHHRSPRSGGGHPRFSTRPMPTTRADTETDSADDSYSDSNDDDEDDDHFPSTGNHRAFAATPAVTQSVQTHTPPTRRARPALGEATLEKIDFSKFSHQASTTRASAPRFKVQSASSSSRATREISHARKQPMDEEARKERVLAEESSEPTYTNTYPAGFPRGQEHTRASGFDGGGGRRYGSSATRGEGATRHQNPPTFEPRLRPPYTQSTSSSAPAAAATDKLRSKATLTSDKYAFSASRTAMTSPAAKGYVGAGGDRPRSPDSPSPAPSVNGRTRVMAAEPRSRNGLGSNLRPSSTAGPALSRVQNRELANRESSVGSGFEEMARKLRSEVEQIRLGDQAWGSRSQPEARTEEDDAADHSNSGSGTKVAGNSSGESLAGRKRGGGPLTSRMNAHGWPDFAAAEEAAVFVNAYPAHLRPGAPEHTLRRSKASSLPGGVRLPADVTGVTSALESPCKARDGVKHIPFHEDVGIQVARLEELGHLRAFVDGLQIELTRAGERILNLEETQEEQRLEFDHLRREMEDCKNGLEDVRGGDFVRRIADQIRSEKRGDVYRDRRSSRRAEDDENDDDAVNTLDQHGNRGAGGGGPTAMVRRLYDELDRLRASMEDQFLQASRKARGGGKEAPSSNKRSLPSHSNQTWQEIESLRVQVVHLADEVERLNGVIEKRVVEQQQQRSNRPFNVVQADIRSRSPFSTSLEQRQARKGGSEWTSKVSPDKVDQEEGWEGREGSHRSDHAKSDDAIRRSSAGLVYHHPSSHPASEPAFLGQSHHPAKHTYHHARPASKNGTRSSSPESEASAKSSTPPPPLLNSRFAGAKNHDHHHQTAIPESDFDQSAADVTITPANLNRESRDREEEEEEEEVVGVERGGEVDRQGSDEEEEEEEDISIVAQARAERSFAKIKVRTGSKTGGGRGKEGDGLDHDARRCTVCSSRKRSDRKREARKERAREVERERETNMIEEEILVNLVRGPTTSASNLTKRQTSTLTRILEEHMDEFIHQRMLYSELADELKLVHPGMNAIKRKILAEHVLEAVEALEQKAERINLLQTLLPEGFEVDFWSGGEGEEGEELKQGDWKEDGTRRNGKHDRPSSDDLVFDEYEGRKVVGSRRDPIRRVGPDVRKVDPKEDQEDRGQQVDPTSLLPPQDRPAKQDKAKRSSKRSKPTSTNTGHVDRNREGDDGASRRRSKKVIQATSSGGGVINPFSRARYSPPVVDSQEPPRWEEEEEQDPTKSKRERFEKGEPNDPTPTTNVRTSSHQRLARQQDQRNEVNRSTWPTSWNARR